MIAIKNMTMPESCEDCRFSEHYENRSGDRIVLCELADDVEVVGKSETIPEACPLIEIPDDAIIFSEKMCCLARGIGEPLIAHYYSSEELERLWERATSNAPRNPEDAYREDFGKEKGNE